MNRVEGVAVSDSRGGRLAPGDGTERGDDGLDAEQDQVSFSQALQAGGHGEMLLQRPFVFRLWSPKSSQSWQQ